MVLEVVADGDDIIRSELLEGRRVRMSWPAGLEDVQFENGLAGRIGQAALVVLENLLQKRQ